MKIKIVALIINFRRNYVWNSQIYNLWSCKSTKVSGHFYISFRCKRHAEFNTDITDVFTESYITRNSPK